MISESTVFIWIVASHLVCTDHKTLKVRWKLTYDFDELLSIEKLVLLSLALLSEEHPNFVTDIFQQDVQVRLHHESTSALVTHFEQFAGLW